MKLIQSPVSFGSRSIGAGIEMTCIRTKCYSALADNLRTIDALPRKRAAEMAWGIGAGLPERMLLRLSFYGSPAATLRCRNSGPASCGHPSLWRTDRLLGGSSGKTCPALPLRLSNSPSSCRADLAFAARRVCAMRRTVSLSD